MTSPTFGGFQRHLTRFQEFLTKNSPELIEQFKMTSPQDVRRVCLEIQDRQGRDGNLRRMRRMEGFIEAMDQLGKSIEVFVNANEFVCFVWGPVKFLLGVAKQYLDSFDKLLDVYAKVGEAMPGLTVYQSTFEKYPPLATVLEDYYSDILRFHEAALCVFTRPKWKTVFKSVWKTFDTQFKPVLDSLNRRRELLESEKGSATLNEISKSREEIDAINKEIKKASDLERFENHKWRLAHVKDKLDAPDYQLDQEMATEDRNGSASGKWMLQDQAFRKWVDRGTREHRVLYVNGIPGAGKTTLASSIVSELMAGDYTGNSGCDTLVVYFYFKHNQANKRTQNSLLKAMMEQIMARDPSLSDHLFDELASMTGVNLRSTKKLETLVTTSFEHFRTCLIVIDGLDEAAPGEAIKTLKWLLPEVERPVQDNGTSMRLLFSGQRDGVLDNELSSHPFITLETASDHEMDIRNYCAQVGAHIRVKFGLSSEMESDIVSQVTTQANGMFLYARVVLENLLSQTRLSRLRQEMQPGVFPDGIERAYERVAARIFRDSPPAQREDAAKILGWLTCAERLLYWREIQALFCIDPETGQVDYEGERPRLSCKQLCGSLVDIHHAKNGQDGPDDIAKIVHATARDYMIRSGWVNLGLEHAKAATFCFRYLTSAPFLCGESGDQVLQYARRGYYAFQDYSVQYSLDHFLKSAEPSASDFYQTTISNAIKAAEDFLKSYTVPERLPVMEDLFSHGAIIQFIRDLPKEPRERDQIFDITCRTLAIRRQIEVVRQESATTDELDIINNLYGFEDNFKCPKPWCTNFTAGFATKLERAKHVNCHERPYCCSEESCFASSFGFKDEVQLKEHMNTHHPIANESVRFPKRVGTAQRAVQNPLGIKDFIEAAVVQGDVEQVLQHVDFVRRFDKWRYLLGSTLILAAEEGQLEICKQLLDSGHQLWDESLDTTITKLRCVSKALLCGNLDVLHLFLCQPELNTDQALRKLPDWINTACCHGAVDALKLILESPAFSTIDTGSFDECERWTILNGGVNSPSLETLRYLLEYGFSASVTPNSFFRAEIQGREDLVDLLRPIIDKTHPPYSSQRADSLLSYLGVGSSCLSHGQMIALKNLSPEAQRRTVWRYKYWPSTAAEAQHQSPDLASIFPENGIEMQELGRAGCMLED